MIFANLEIANYLIRCANPTCKNNPEYISTFYIDKNKDFFIKKGTVYLYLLIGDEDECYCYDCIDVVYQQLKPILDKKLWAFK